jgi:hypothetical protein
MTGTQYIVIGIATSGGSWGKEKVPEELLVFAISSSVLLLMKCRIFLKNFHPNYHTQKKKKKKKK